MKWYRAASISGTDVKTWHRLTHLIFKTTLSNRLIRYHLKICESCWTYREMNTWKEYRRKVKSLSRVPLFATPWTVIYQDPLSMGFSRQEYWSGLPFPSSIKKAECQRTDAFKLRCWRRLLRIPWISRRSSQSILREINPKYSLEGLILKLKLQYSSHLIQRANSLEKILMLGKTEGKRRRERQRMR